MRTFKCLGVFILVIGLTLSIFGCSMAELENSLDKLTETISGTKTVLVFEAVIPNGMNEADIADGMETAQTVLRKRLDDQMYNEATVQLVGDRRIRVEIPEITNPEEAVELLGKTAVLEFRDADGNVALTGDVIKEARAEYGSLQQNGPSQYYVALTLKSEAVPLFTEMTKKAAGRSADGTNYIAIVLDGVVQSAPYVDAEYATTGINTEEVTITVGEGDGELGKTPEEYAKELASIINSGRLPFDLKLISAGN